MTIVPATSALVAVVLAEPGTNVASVLQACGATPGQHNAGNVVAHISGWNGVLLYAADGEVATRAADAVVGYIDGNAGIGAKFAQAWAVAIDHDVPRLLLVDHSVAGRADFDEVVAIAQRVLGDDVLTRYLPLADDDGMVLAGLFDVLRNQIITSQETRTGEPEHLHHTSQARVELIDALAHIGLADSALSSHRSGNPTSVPALAATWLSDDVVAALPADEGMSAPLLWEWLSARQSLWVPVVLDDEMAVNVNDYHATVGIGIAQGVARVWGSDAHAVCVGIESEQLCDVQAPVTLNDLIAPHDTIRLPGSSARVLAPGI